MRFYTLKHIYIGYHKKYGQESDNKPGPAGRFCLCKMCIDKKLYN